MVTMFRVGRKERIDEYIIFLGKDGERGRIDDYCERYGRKAASNATGERYS